MWNKGSGFGSVPSGPVFTAQNNPAPELEMLAASAERLNRGDWKHTAYCPVTLAEALLLVMLCWFCELPFPVESIQYLSMQLLSHLKKNCDGNIYFNSNNIVPANRSFLRTKIASLSLNADFWPFTYSHISFSHRSFAPQNECAGCMTLFSKPLEQTKQSVYGWDLTNGGFKCEFQMWLWRFILFPPWNV